jgi:hypothetical protein
MNASYRNAKRQALAQATETKAEKTSFGDKCRKGAIYVGTAGGCGAAVYLTYKGGKAVLERVRN